VEHHPIRRGRADYRIEREGRCGRDYQTDVEEQEPRTAPPRPPIGDPRPSPEDGQRYQDRGRGQREGAVAGDDELRRLDAQVPGGDVDRGDDEASEESRDQAHAGHNAWPSPTHDALTALLPVCTAARSRSMGRSRD